MGGDYPYVKELTVYKGELIAGGSFTIAGDVPCNRVARWDGSAWQPLGSGINENDPYGSVKALTVYNGELIVGGSFTTAGGATCNNIARWDGAQWQPLGSGVDSYTVYALVVDFDSTLIAGGNLTAAGGIPCNRIARWDGEQWQPLGDGMGGGGPYGGNPYVSALALYNGELIAGGHFVTAGGLVSAGWARWSCYGTCCLEDGACESTMPADCVGEWLGREPSCHLEPCVGWSLYDYVTEPLQVEPREPDAHDQAVTRYLSDYPPMAQTPQAWFESRMFSRTRGSFQHFSAFRHFLATGIWLR